MKRKIITISDVSLACSTWIEISFALSFHKVKKKSVEDVDLQLWCEFEGLNPYLGGMCQLKF